MSSNGMNPPARFASSPSIPTSKRRSLERRLCSSSLPWQWPWSMIENLCRSLEIVGICPYWTVVIALYEKFLSWKLFQKMTGIFALEECEVAENIHQVTLSDTGLPQVQHVLIMRLGIYLLSERTVWLVFQYVSVTKVKVCGKKYLVHDHRRFRSRFRLKAPGLMVNVSRMQGPCVIGAITDSHSDVLIIDFISWFDF